MATRLDVSLSRRRLLAGVSAAAAGLVGSASIACAKAPLQNTQAPAFYRFKIGSIEVRVLPASQPPAPPVSRLPPAQTAPEHPRGTDRDLILSDATENPNSNYDDPNLEKRINNRNDRPTHTENQANDR